MDITGVELPLKLVFVTKRKKTDYLALGTTKTNLQPDQIIQLYARRWSIETFFKFTNQYLRLAKTQSRNLDDMYGHLAMVVLCYEQLAWIQRQENDEHTLGDLFYILGDAMPNIRIVKAINLLLTTLSGLDENYEQITARLVQFFIQSLPISYQKQIKAVSWFKTTNFGVIRFDTMHYQWILFPLPNP